MRVINARNVEHALGLTMPLLRAHGVERDSRNGPVLKFAEPVTTLYQYPQERVLFNRARDANPFFHLFESLWMLAGRQDTAYLCHILPRMLNYSDDGETFWGAYGYRWRHLFGFDQLPVIIDRLANNPDDRRCVLQMWAPTEDLGADKKDVPCNTNVYFWVEDEQLHMTVCNRSNDIIWGAYGANAVHFSVLQEFVASALYLGVGKYWQVSNNLHAYTDIMDKMKLEEQEFDHRFYVEKVVEPFPLMSVPWQQWLRELEMFLENGPVVGIHDPFFRRVAAPLWEAFECYKHGEGVTRYDAAIKATERCKATDWQMACADWLDRRRRAYIKANDDGVEYE